MGCAASRDRRPRKRYRIPALCGCSREPWKNFRSHPICALYKPIRKLGSGAFSEVRSRAPAATMARRKQLPPCPARCAVLPLAAAAAASAACYGPDHPRSRSAQGLSGVLSCVWGSEQGVPGIRKRLLHRDDLAPPARRSGRPASSPRARTWRSRSCSGTTPRCAATTAACYGRRSTCCARCATTTSSPSASTSRTPTTSSLC